jgi:hypothetical protein
MRVRQVVDTASAGCGQIYTMHRKFLPRGYRTPGAAQDSLGVHGAPPPAYR